MATKKDSKKTTGAARKRTTAAPSSPTVAPVPKTIAGVKTDVIKPELIKQALAEVGLDNKKLVTDLIPDLISYYKGNYTEDELYVCDSCGGLSVEADPACPFCGDADIADGDATPEPEQKLVKTDVNKKKTTKPATTKPAAKKPKTTKPKAAKPKAAKPQAPEATAELVTGVDAETQAIREKFTSKELDKKVGAIHKSMAAFAECSYTLGQQIKELHDTDMWKVRADDNGRVAYTNFKHFCEAELGMSFRWAYNLMDVVANFDRGLVKQVGTEKLKLLLSAPEDDREALLEEAKQGISKRELQKKIKAAKQNAPTPAATPAQNRYITAVLKPCTRKKVKMYKSKGVKKNDDPVRAGRLADEPCFEFESENGVVFKGKIVQSVKAGELELVLTIAK